MPTPKYDEDRELTLYVFHNYFRLLTETEWYAQRRVVLEFKAAHASTPERAAEMIARAPIDAASQALLAEGRDAFRRRTRDRILREHADKVVVNRCARCGGVARTPKARQCWFCGYDWH